MKRKYFVWGIALSVLLAGILGYLQFNRERDSLKYTDPKFSVKAEDLLQEFISNENEAGKKYAGQSVILAVTGEIKEVIKNTANYYTLVMGDTSSLSSVRCLMDSTFSTGYRDLKRGTTVTIKGNFNGYKADEMGIGADIELNYCILSSPKISK